MAHQYTPWEKQPSAFHLVTLNLQILWRVKLNSSSRCLSSDDSEYTFCLTANVPTKIRIIFQRPHVVSWFFLVLLNSFCKNIANRVQSSLLVLLRCSIFYTKVVFSNRFISIFFCPFLSILLFLSFSTSVLFLFTTFLWLLFPLFYQAKRFFITFLSSKRTKVK